VRPRIGLTIGDAAGIGPEIILALAAHWPADRAELIVFGSGAVLDWTARAIPGLAAFSGRVVESPSSPTTPFDFDFGRPSPTCARLQHESLVAAVEAALAGRIEAVVTAPWTKHILALAGLPPTGHTEVLAARCGVDEPTMMLCGDQLRVALVTTHLPLRAVPAALSAARIQHHLETLDGDLRRRFGIAQPHIAVCGLNPHAGEAGIMGDEEERLIRPAIAAARAAGIDAVGPFPADTLFAHVVRDQPADAVLAMYHDQGLAPLKLWHFGASANVTLGLPIVRTSPDHGTAYDIAGRGVADPSSLVYAADLALRLCRQEARKREETR
jgi:4-hydroxythreonine-4-phosphate dehydrogenase